MAVPLIKPAPPQLSQAASELRKIEKRGIFSNFGPVNTALEASMVEQLFQGIGHCTTVCNATLGLMLAIRAVISAEKQNRKRYALMPAFTFAAAAQAAMWCGLTPLFCDIDPLTWSADPSAEDEMIRKFGNRIAVIVPYATFGFNIDLERYNDISKTLGIPVVVDAAASFGSINDDGYGFGTGSDAPVVFSMHATKTFSTGEGGVIYSADKSLINKLRQMSNFGFGAPRTATMPGLNAKLNEISALQAQMRLNDFSAIVARRQKIVDQYRKSLPELTFQKKMKKMQSHQFVPALLPADASASRDVVQEILAQEEIGIGRYFSPHLAEQAYFRENAVAGELPITQDVADRVISLPVYDKMSDEDVECVIAALREALLLGERKDYRCTARQAASQSHALNRI